MKKTNSIYYSLSYCCGQKPFMLENRLVEICLWLLTLIQKMDFQVLVSILSLRQRMVQCG